MRLIFQSFALRYRMQANHAMLSRPIIARVYIRIVSYVKTANMFILSMSILEMPQDFRQERLE